MTQRKQPFELSASMPPYRCRLLLRRCSTIIKRILAATTSVFSRRKRHLSYSFRIRMNRTSLCTIETALSQIEIAVKEPGISLSLRPISSRQVNKRGGALVTYWRRLHVRPTGRGGGPRYEDALLISLAKMRIGVDLGGRTPKAGITVYGQELLSNQTGQRVLNNVHGLMVYASDPKPMFFEMKGSAIIGRNFDSFDKRYFSTPQPKLSDRERLALTLFHASYFQPTADTRFLVLVMAIEALIEPKPKSRGAVRYVDIFRELIHGSSLPDHEKSSLAGSLKWLRDESINQAGKRLVNERLGDKPYHTKPAPKFFSYVYGLRSDLVHGNLPYPTFDEIAGVVAIVEDFVSDLLITGFMAESTEQMPLEE